MPQRQNVTILDARIMFRNFAGQERQFNSEGDRNFCVFLDPETAENMLREGWNVKTIKGREEGDEPQPYVQVAVNYKKGRPPRCSIVTSRGRTELGAEEVSMLDVADVARWDVTLTPYEWEVNGNKGVKAYAKTVVARLNEDELDLMYADVPDAKVGISTTPTAEAEWSDEDDD